MSVPQIDAANAVATMLNGQVVNGFALSVATDRLLPKYEVDSGELSALRVDVVPGSLMTMTRVSRGTLSESCPVVVGVQKQCDLDDYAGLIGLLRGIAALVATTELDGFGVPSEDVEFGDDATSVDTDGVFRGYITTAYTTFA